MPPQDNEHHAAQLQLSDVIYAHSDKSFLQFMKKVLESEDRPPLCTRLPGAVPARPGSKGPILAEKNIPLGWGPRLLLFHCVRARRADLLRVLASPPPWLQDPARLPQQGAVGPAGLEPPWLRFLLDEGGLQVLLDADGDAGAGAGALYPIAASAILNYIDLIRRASLPAWAWASLGRGADDLHRLFLLAALRVPEAATPARVDAAAAAVRGLQDLPPDRRERLLADGPESPLAAALRAGRAAVLEEILREIGRAHV